MTSVNSQIGDNFQIGDIVEVFCGRCRLNLDASVAALEAGKVVKVTCRTCHNEVKFRPPRDEKAWKAQQLQRLLNKQERRRQALEKPAAAPAVGSGGRAELRQLWDELTDKVDARSAKVYDPTRTYQTEDALLHKKLGMGIVYAVDADGELRVLFRTGFHAVPSQQEPSEDD